MIRLQTDSFSYAWRALSHRNFKLYFFGQSISVIGTWMTRLATTWLVYRLTHSALLLGVVSFSGQIVAFLLGPFAGVIVERMERRKMLIWTQALAAIQSLALAALALTNVITLWEVIALSAFQGFINAFDMPGRQSFLVHMLEDKKDLGNAIAINSSMVNGARLVGPAIAGLVVGAVGEGWCFFIDGVSYIAVIASLVMMQVPQTQTLGKTNTILVQMREGWNYVRTFTPVRTLLTLFCLVSFMGFPYAVLMPVFASQVFHGNATTLGWLMAATGVGALISALSLTLRKTVVGLTRMLQIASAVLGAGLILFGLSNVFWVSWILLVFVGFGLMQSTAATNTVIQSLVPEDKRARVMSYYTMGFFGSAPVGSLIAGTAAHWIGAQMTVVATGTCCILGAIWFSTRLPIIRPIMAARYREVGILPNAAE